jgi:phage protein D
MAVQNNSVGIISASPGFEINGNEQPQLNDSLLTLMVEETTEGLSRCEACFGNWGTVNDAVNYLYFDRTHLDFGKEITVTMNSVNGTEKVFKGKISALEGQFPQMESPQLVVLAEDAAQSLRVTRRSRTFENVSDVEVFEQIATEHGLQSEVNISGPNHTIMAQLNQSDLAFLRERAQQIGVELWIQDEKLHVQNRLNRQQQGGDSTAEYLEYEYNRPDSPKNQLLEFSVIADTANQYTQVMVSGWDIQAKDTISYKATDEVLGTELNGDESGARIVKTTRVDRITCPHPLTSMEAQTLAEAAFRAQARRFVVGTGKVAGDPHIRVGRIIDLQNLGSLFSGTYYITEARHLFSREEGYTTEFVVERVGIGR